MTEQDTRALVLRLIALVEPLAVLPGKVEQMQAEIATLMGYAEKHEGAIERFDERITNFRGVLERQADGLFAISKDLQDLRQSVLGKSANPPPLEHERIDRLSERAR